MLTRSAAPPHDKHTEIAAVFNHAANTLPAWLRTDANQFARFKAASLPSFEGLLRSPRAARLHEDYAQYLLDERQLNLELAQLPALEVFAEPLLKQAISQTFGVDVDVRQTLVFNAERVQSEGAFETASEDPLVRSFKAVKAATQSLLTAALQNFEAWETEPVEGRTGGRSRIFRSAPQSGDEQELARITPYAFADCCRKLDLGGQYQALLTSVLGASGPALYLTMNRFERSSLRVHAHIALLQGQLSEPLHGEMLAMLDNPRPAFTDGAWRGALLHLWDVELAGITVFGRYQGFQTGYDAWKWLRQHPGQPVVVYLPGDPEQALREYASFGEFSRVLRERLLAPEYRAFFARFIPARHRQATLRRLQGALSPKVWNPGGWYEERANPDADLSFRDQGCDEVFSALAMQRIRLLKDDALFHAVPTAEEDHKSLQAKLQYFIDLSVDALNLAALVVPALGPMMLAVTAAQMIDEVYEGFVSLHAADRDQAWSYFLDVIENTVLMAGLGVAGGQVAALETPAVVERMHPVRMADGRTRLWHPDMDAYHHEQGLPAHIQATSQGLYPHEGRQWLRLDGRLHAVRLDADGLGGRLEHPTRPQAYQPWARQNAEGIWRHQADEPAQWQRGRLLRRLGPLSEQFTEAQLGDALAISDTHEAVLRQSLAHSERLPALLTDALDRIALEADLLEVRNLTEESQHSQLFTALYAISQGEPAVEAEPILAVFPGLPLRVVNELIEHASAAELAQLRSGERVPMRIAVEARAYLQQVRLARAREAVFLHQPVGADGQKLVLEALGQLPGWPQALRIEIRRGDLDGQLLAASGDPDAPLRRTLIQQDEGFHPDRPDVTVHADLFSALFAALPSSAHEALGLPALDGGAALRSQAQAAPLPPSQRMREWLGMQPVSPGVRSPMRLADGRLGYPLSGHVNLAGAITDALLLDKIRALALTDVFAEDLLARLTATGLDRAAINQRLDALLLEQQRLQLSLTQWRDQAAPGSPDPAREGRIDRLAEALWAHWRSSCFPDAGRSPAPLRLASIDLADFPRSLPPFMEPRVQELILDDVNIPGPSAVIDGQGTVRYQESLSVFLRRFPRTRVLEMRACNGWPDTELVSTLVASLPELVELRLLDQRLRIDQTQVDGLLRLTRLERLDLSGNTLEADRIVGLGSARLVSLRLERMGIAHWPRWLDEAALARIGTLSLADNQLITLPAQLLGARATGGEPTRIDVRNNRLVLQTLLDVGLDQAERPFRIETSLSDDVRQQLQRRLHERQQLHQAIDAWLEAPPANADQARLASRREIAQSIRVFWREMQGNAFVPLLQLDGIHLDDFPFDLPWYFYRRTTRIELLDPVGSPEALDRLLARFEQLEDLAVARPATPLSALPERLLRMPGLRTLSVTDAGLHVDQGVIDFILSLPELWSLELDGNTLGAITDVSAFAGRYLNLLSLNDMGLTRWPEWLDQLVPERVQFLSLDNNQFTVLPEHLLANRRSPEHFTEISLLNNPLSHDTLVRAHVSMADNRPYVFIMNLPEDIRAMPPEPHPSDSEEPASGSSSGSESGAPEAPVVVEPWLAGNVQADEARQAIWQRLHERGDVGQVLTLISRLQQTADYRSAGSRTQLIERVWQVLRALEDDAGLAALLNGMAEEPLQQLHVHDTCPDGIRLVFNQMEIQVFTRQALDTAPEAERGPALYRLMRRLYRLQALDDAAVEHAGIRDEAEVRLAYRLHWARELDLPLPPGGMLYRRAADIRPGELDDALSQVRQGESGQPLLHYAAQRDFWLAWLRETHAERFTVLRQHFEARVLELDDRYPDESGDERARRIHVLEAERTRDERLLIFELTREQGDAVDGA